MPPSNQTAATAITISSLPFVTSQNAVEGTTPYDLWYKYTAVTEDLVLSIICFSGYTSGPATTYRPIIRIYVSDNPSDSDPLHTNISANNKPIQVQVGAGRTYFIEIVPNNSTITVGGTISIDIISIPRGNVLAGAIFVNDDTAWNDDLGMNKYMPGYFANHVTGTIYGMRQDIVSGETGDILNNGRFILSDEVSETSAFVIYNRDLTRDVTITDPELANYWVGENISTNQTSKFYISKRSVAGPGPHPQPQIKSLDQNGVVSGTWDLNVDTTTAERFLRALAVSKDDTVLYYGVLTADQSIRRYDLVNNVNMTNLQTGIPPGTTGVIALTDLIILDNGTLVGVYGNSSTGDWSLVNFSSSGTILHVHNYTEAANGDLNRVVRSSTNPDSVWAWLMPPQGAAYYIMGYREININTGAILNEFQSVTYQGGVYDGPETGTPESRFGHPISCPMIQLTQNEAPPRTGLYTIVPGKRDEDMPPPIFRTGLMP